MLPFNSLPVIAGNPDGYMFTFQQQGIQSALQKTRDLKETQQKVQ